MEKIDLDSPYSHLLVKNIVQNLITSDKNLNKENIENMYKAEVRKLKEFYNFLCPKCLQIQFIRYINGVFIISCRNNHNYSEKIKTLEQLRILSKFILQ